MLPLRIKNKGNSILDTSIITITLDQNIERRGVFIKDIDGDGDQDIVVRAGNILEWFENISSVSIQENINLIDLNIHPNPTKSTITINLGNNNLNNASIKIIDLLGKEIHSQKVNTQTTTLNLSNYAKGIYLIKFSNDLGGKIYKVIKE